MNTILILAVLLAPGEDIQTEPSVEAPAPIAPAAKPKNHTEERKDARDRVLLKVGNDALAFTQRYGDLGISSLEQCDPDTGKRIVALFNSGELAKLKSPVAALRAVQQHGTAAGAWLCDHHEQLEDPEALECFHANPMEYVFNLRDIDQQAAWLRESRRRVPPWLGNAMAGWNVYHVIIGVLALALLVMIVWKRAPTDDS